MSRAYFPQSEIEEQCGRMIRTAKRVSLDPYLFGVGEQQSTHGGSGEGPGAIQAMKDRSEDIVLCCDSADVAFLAGAEEIVQKFKSTDLGFIVSGERHALHGLRSTEKLNAFHGYFTQINVGLWIGYRQYAIDVIQWAIDHYRDHEDTYGQDTLQAWLPLMYVDQSGPKFEIDRECALFQSMNSIHPGDIEWQEKRAMNVVTMTYPVALHYNGDKSRVAYKQTVEELLR